MNRLMFPNYWDLLTQRWLDAVEEHASYSARHFNKDQIVLDAGSDGNVEMRNLTQAVQVSKLCWTKILQAF